MAHTFGTGAQFPTTGTATDANNPATFSYTCPAGSTVLCLMIAYAGSTDRAGGAPSYNGVAMTQAGTVHRGSPSPECSCEIWYLLDPPTGSSLNFSVPNTGTLASKYYIGTGIAGSGMVSALDVVGGADTAGTNPSATVTPTVNGAIIFAVVANGAQAWNSTAVSGTAEIAEGDLGAWGAGSQYFLQATAAAKAMSWTFGTSEDYGIAVAAFKEVTAPVGHPSRRRVSLASPKAPYSPSGVNII